MDLAELQRRVDRYVKVDLKSFYDAYLASGGGDIDGFLTFLAEARAVDPAVLKELHGMGDVETPSLQDPAYSGTLLATWAKTATMRATRRGPGSPTAGAPPAFAVPDPSGTDVRFKPVSRLGEGAMGTVDIARDVYLRRKVALKTVLPEMAGQPGDLRPLPVRDADHRAARAPQHRARVRARRERRRLARLRDEAGAGQGPRDDPRARRGRGSRRACPSARSTRSRSASSTSSRSATRSSTRTTRASSTATSSRRTS